MRWALTIVTLLLVALWLASGFPGVRWHWPDAGGKAGARQGSSGLVFGPARPTEGRTLWTVIIDRGQVQVARYHSVMPEVSFRIDLERRVYWSPSHCWFTWPEWSVSDDEITGVRGYIVGDTRTGVKITPIPSTPTLAVSLPLWIPPLLTAIPAAFLWRGRLRFLRRRRAGECLRCGYALAGLPVDETGGKPTCPECGT